jgi:hypothetical protein
MIKKNLIFKKNLKKNTKLKTSWYSKLVDWVMRSRQQKIMKQNSQL